MKDIVYGVALGLLILVGSARGQTYGGQTYGGQSYGGPTYGSVGAGTNSTAPLHSTNTLSSQVTLYPTVTAPASARGEAQVDPNKQRLHLKLSGLGPGKYQLRVTRKSDGATFYLSPIVLSDPEKGPDTQANDNARQESTAHATSTLQSDSEVELPRELQGTELARISVSDYGGTVLLDSAKEASRTSSQGPG